MRITFSGVTKVFEPDIVALRDIKFQIEKGEFVYVIGATGSGTSTLLRLITREILPSRGAITVGNFRLRDMKRSDIPYYRRDVGLVAQDFKLIPTLTVYDNIAYPLKYTGRSKEEIRARVLELLELVDLLDKVDTADTVDEAGPQSLNIVSKWGNASHACDVYSVHIFILYYNRLKKRIPGKRGCGVRGF